MTVQARHRWDDYVLADDEAKCQELWSAARTETGRALLICGAGFDPRTLDAPNALASLNWDNLTVIGLRSGIDGDHASASESANRHEQALRDSFTNVHFIDPDNVEDPASTGTMISRNIVANYAALTFDVVIVDMSGLPSSISFPIIQLFLNQSMTTEPATKFSGNLFVAVSEDASTDARIVPTGLGKANTLGGLPRLAEDETTRIWVPVLGEGASEELKSLATFLKPAETCPVVPFPSSRPRRADELILEHRTLLFDELQIEPRNILYASESNPFDLYRQLVLLAERYRRALQPLGSPTIIASEHTSKLLALGVLLAAHEAGIVVSHVRPTGYRLEGDEVIDRQPSIYTAWLTGIPYAAGPQDPGVSRP